MNCTKFGKNNITSMNANESEYYNGSIHDSINVSIEFMSPKVLPNSSKLIYLHIMTQINEDKFCYKSNSRIAEELRMNITTVSHSVKKFVQLNLLSTAYLYPHKNGERVIYLSPSNYKHVMAMDNAFRKKHNLPSNGANKKRNIENIKHNHRYSYKNGGNNAHKKSNKHITKISKLDDDILNEVVHELSIRSNYQPKPAKRAIISEYYNGNASIQRIKYAFWVALYKSKHGTRPVKSLVGLMCNISNNVDIDTLKIQCHRDYRIMYIKDKQKKEDNESARRLENDGIYF